MKTLIEKSIQIYGIGHPDTKTVFNIEKEEDKKDIRFKSLTSIGGRTLTVWFDYNNDNELVKEQKLSLKIIKGTEEEIKDFILKNINSYLNK